MNGIHGIPPSRYAQCAESALRFHNTNSGAFQDCKKYLDEELVPHLNGTGSTATPNEDMRRAIKLLDRVLFGGVMEDVAFEWNEHMEPFRGQVPLGVTSIKDGSVLIEMEPDVTRYDIAGSKAEKYLSVLLHEMVHAFFRVIDGGCTCNDCLKVDRDQLGKTGHGEPFARLTKVVEDFVNATSLLHVDLHREDDAAYFWKHDGREYGQDTYNFCFPGKIVTIWRGRMRFEKTALS